MARVGQIQGEEQRLAEQNPDKPIAQRVCDFFESQLAWYGLVLDDLEGFSDCLAEDAVDELEGGRSCYGRDIAEQEAQLSALLSEWRSCSEPGHEDVSRVRALASRAEEMSLRVADELHRASVLAGARADEVRRNLDRLRDGRRMFCGYRQDHTGGPGIIDETV